MEIEEGVFRRITPSEISIILHMIPTCPQVFSVNAALTCNCAALLTSSVDKSQNSSKFGKRELVMVNYTCAFRQSGTEKYFE